jgi:hypothetical protein
VTGSFVFHPGIVEAASGAKFRKKIDLFVIADLRDQFFVAELRLWVNSVYGHLRADINAKPEFIALDC